MGACTSGEKKDRSVADRIREEEERKRYDASVARLTLKFVDNTGVIMRTKVGGHTELNYEFPLLGTVQKLRSHVYEASMSSTSQAMISPGTRLDEVAISFRGQRAELSKTLKALGVTPGDTLEAQIDGVRREKEKRVRSNGDINYSVNLWCNDPVAAALRHGPIGEWDTSPVTEMDELFKGQRGFNDNISHWDVSNVIRMNWMFKGASSFNQPLDGWDLSSLQAYSNMFQGATSYLQSGKKRPSGRVVNDKIVAIWAAP